VGMEVDSRDIVRVMSAKAAGNCLPSVNGDAVHGSKIAQVWWGGKGFLVVSFWS